MHTSHLCLLLWSHGLLSMDRLVFLFLFTTNSTACPRVVDFLSEPMSLLSRRCSQKEITRLKLRWPKIRLSTFPVNHTQILIPGKQFNSFSRHCTQSEKPFIPKWWNDVINMCPVYSHTVNPVKPPNTNPFPWLTKTHICKLAYFGGPSVRVQVRAAFFLNIRECFWHRKIKLLWTLSLYLCKFVHYHLEGGCLMRRTFRCTCRMWL